MLFTPDSIIDARRELFAQMEAGKLTREEAFQRALELDPFDAVALIVLGEVRFNAGDLAGAAEYLWRAVSADPCRYDPWFKLHASLPGESADFRGGILELAALKTLRDPDGVEHFKELFKDNPRAADFADGAEFLETTADVFYEKRADEPEDVSERLRPYRLIDDVLEIAEDGLDDELVDGILEDGARCGPLLVGVLRAMATESLPIDNPAPVVCSLALLGEIGDPAVLPELIECYGVDDELIEAAATWAVRRMALRRPEEFLEALRRLAPAADAGERCNLAIAVNHLADLPGKRDFLLSLLDGLASFPKSERQELFTAVAMGLAHAEGAKGRELAWSLLSRHSAELPKRMREELRDVFEIQQEFDRTALSDEGPEATIYDLCSQTYSGDEEDEEDEEDEDDEDEDEHEEDFIPAPIRRSVTPGRNDPCWCGSGKKYKKCHLESDEKSQRARPSPDDAPKERPHQNAEESNLRKRLMEFAAGALRKREFEDAMMVFLGPEPPTGVDDETLSMESLDWLIHDYVPPKLGHSIIQEFLKRSPGGLTMRQRKILEAWSRARYSIFEVQEVRRGSGVRVKDLLVGGERFVDDVNTSKRAALWDGYLARVEEFEGHHVFTATLMKIPQPLVAPLKEWAIGARERSGLSWEKFLHANSHRMRQEAARLISRGADASRVVSMEGDELVFSRARYAVQDEDAVRQAIEQSKAFHPEDPGEYGWLDETEDATGGRRAFGHVHLGGGELTLECSTRQRLERGKALLQVLAGGHLRHLDDDFTSWQSAMRDRKASPDAPEGSGLPPDLERELVQKVLDEHYRKWLDMGLPALDGKTPREAVTTAKGRAQVLELLKLPENGEEHKGGDGLAWYDVSKLKAALGIEF